MRKTNPKRTLHFYFFLCSITLLTVTSCVFTKNQKEESIFASLNNTTKYENVEAEVLAKFNQRNANLITISTKAKEKEIPFRIKCLADSLIEEQNTINEVINQITKEKLIIIPNIHLQKNVTKIDKTKTENFKKIYLETVTAILTNQIQDLTVLSEATKDADFKILALQTIVKLNTSLDRVNEIKTSQT